MGHSLGGYFVLYALAEGLRTQAAFTHYVAASPSLYYQQDYLQRTLPAQPAALTPLSAQTVLLTVGEREIGRGDAESRATQTALRAYTQAFASRNFSVVTLRQLTYPNYGHLETAVRSFVDGWKALPQAK